jgi:hypothetical protein
MMPYGARRLGLNATRRHAHCLTSARICQALKRRERRIERRFTFLYNLPPPRSDSTLRRCAVTRDSCLCVETLVKNTEAHVP